MRRAQPIIVCGLTVLLVLSTAAGQEFSAELQRGRKLLDQLAGKPPTPRKVFAEVRAADQVVGYTFIRLEPDSKIPIRSMVEAIIQMPGAQISGLIKAETDLKLQPRRVELRRGVRQQGGKEMVQQQTLEVKDGKVEITVSDGARRRTRTQALPKGPVFFSVDLLAARTEIGRINEPFALHELDPQTGEPRLLVFRPSTETDGTRIMKVLVDGEKPEAVYRFTKDGKLISWSEAGAPLISKVVDEKRGEALIKRFGRPEAAPTTTKAE